GSWCCAVRYDHRRTTGGDGPCPSIRRRLSVGSRAEIFDRIRRQGPDAHLPRSIQCEQDRHPQWRLEVDPEGRRLLQRMQQAAEGLNVTKPRCTSIVAIAAPAAIGLALSAYTPR